MRLTLSIFLAVLIMAFATPVLMAQEAPADLQGEGGEDAGLDEFQTFGPGIEEEAEEIFEAPDESGMKEGPEVPAEPGTLAGVTPGIYLIVTGDNLWDICSRFLGNAFEWPKLWSINQYITNPHYIYPGHKIVFHPGTEVSVPKMEIAKEVDLAAKTEAAPEPVEQLKKPEPKKLTPRKDEAFKIRLRALSFLTKKELKESGRITHSGEPKNMLSSGDNVYLDLKNPENVKVGDKYIVFNTIAKVRHPKGGKFLGYQIMKTATLKIVAIDKPRKKRVFTANIIDNIQTVKRGDRVIPYRDPFVRILPKSIETEVSGYIVGSEPEHRLIGQQEFAYVDLGTSKGIDNGAWLYVVRRGDGLIPAQEKKLPYVVVGKLLVVDAKEKTSTVFVMDSAKDLEIGDEVKTRL